MRSRRSAFSLLEIVVTLAVLAVVFVVLGDLLIAGGRGMGFGSARLDAVADFNRAVEFLRRDARAVFWREEHPILVAESPDGVELWMDVVEGVSLEGLPLVVPVVWRFVPGEAGGTLERQLDPGSDTVRRQVFFSGDLTRFDLVKLDALGDVMPGADVRPPAYLMCGLDHALGERLKIRLSLYSRYHLRPLIDSPKQRWLPNHRLVALAPAFPVITPFSDGTILFTGDSQRIEGGALVATGNEMSMPTIQNP